MKNINPINQHNLFNQVNQLNLLNQLLIEYNTHRIVLNTIEDFEEDHLCEENNNNSNELGEYLNQLNTSMILNGLYKLDDNLSLLFDTKATYSPLPIDTDKHRKIIKIRLIDKLEQTIKIKISKTNEINIQTIMLADPSEPNLNKGILTTNDNNFKDENSEKQTISSFEKLISLVNCRVVEHFNLIKSLEKQHIACVKHIDSISTIMDDSYDYMLSHLLSDEFTETIDKMKNTELEEVQALELEVENLEAKWKEQQALLKNQTYFDLVKDYRKYTSLLN